MKSQTLHTVVKMGFVNRINTVVIGG